MKGNSYSGVQRVLLRGCKKGNTLIISGRGGGDVDSLGIEEEVPCFEAFNLPSPLIEYFVHRC